MAKAPTQGSGGQGGSGLNSQSVSVNTFSKGINDSHTPETMPDGCVATAENYEIGYTGIPQTRQGYETLGSTDILQLRSIVASGGRQFLVPYYEDKIGFARNNPVLFEYKTTAPTSPASDALTRVYVASPEIRRKGDGTMFTRPSLTISTIDSTGFDQTAEALDEVRTEDGRIYNQIPGTLLGAIPVRFLIDNPATGFINDDGIYEITQADPNYSTTGASSLRAPTGSEATVIGRGNLYLAQTQSAGVNAAPFYVAHSDTSSPHRFVLLNNSVSNGAVSAVDTTKSTLTLSTNCYRIGMSVQLTGTTAPTGLSLGVPYFITTYDPATKKAQLSLTPGGAPIAITAAGSGDLHLVGEGAYFWPENTLVSSQGVTVNGPFTTGWTVLSTTVPATDVQVLSVAPGERASLTFPVVSPASMIQVQRRVNLAADDVYEVFAADVIRVNPKKLLAYVEVTNNTSATAYYKILPLNAVPLWNAVEIPAGTIPAFTDGVLAAQGCVSGVLPVMKYDRREEVAAVTMKGPQVIYAKDNNLFTFDALVVDPVNPATTFGVTLQDTAASVVLSSPRFLSLADSTSLFSGVYSKAYVSSGVSVLGGNIRFSTAPFSSAPTPLANGDAVTFLPAQSHYSGSGPSVVVSSELPLGLSMYKTYYVQNLSGGFFNLSSHQDSTYPVIAAVSLPTTYTYVMAVQKLTDSDITHLASNTLVVATNTVNNQLPLSFSSGLVVTGGAADSSTTAGYTGALEIPVNSSLAAVLVVGDELQLVSKATLPDLSVPTTSALDLTIGTSYYVLNITAGKIILSTTPGGDPVLYSSGALSTVFQVLGKSTYKLAVSGKSGVLTAEVLTLTSPPHPARAGKQLALFIDDTNNVIITKNPAETFSTGAKATLDKGQAGVYSFTVVRSTPSVLQTGDSVLVNGLVSDYTVLNTFFDGTNYNYVIDGAVTEVESLDMTALLGADRKTDLVSLGSGVSLLQGDVLMTSKGQYIRVRLVDVAGGRLLLDRKVAISGSETFTLQPRSTSLRRPASSETTVPAISSPFGGNYQGVEESQYTSYFAVGTDSSDAALSTRPRVLGLTSADGNIYASHRTSPTLKTDGTEVALAGLPRWQGELFAGIDTSVPAISTPAGVTYTKRVLENGSMNYYVSSVAPWLNATAGNAPVVGGTVVDSDTGAVHIVSAIDATNKIVTVVDPSNQWTSSQVQYTVNTGIFPTSDVASSFIGLEVTDANTQATILSNTVQFSCTGIMPGGLVALTNYTLASLGSSGSAFKYQVKLSGTAVPITSRGTGTLTLTFSSGLVLTVDTELYMNTAYLGATSALVGFGQNFMVQERDVVTVTAVSGALPTFDLTSTPGTYFTTAVRGRKNQARLRPSDASYTRNNGVQTASYTADSVLQFTKTLNSPFLRPAIRYAYYFKLVYKDTNGKVVGSTASGHSDFQVVLGTPGRIVLKYLRPPALSLVPYEKVELETYRTLGTGIAPYYLQSVQDISYTTAGDYIIITDDQTDEILQNNPTDPVADVLLGIEIPIDVEGPPSADLTANFNNHLVLGGIYSRPKMEFNFQTPQLGASVSTYDLANNFINFGNGFSTVASAKTATALAAIDGLSCTSTSNVRVYSRTSFGANGATVTAYLCYSRLHLNNTPQLSGFYTGTAGTQSTGLYYLDIPVPNNGTDFTFYGSIARATLSGTPYLVASVTPPALGQAVRFGNSTFFDARSTYYVVALTTSGGVTYFNVALLPTGAAIDLTSASNPVSDSMYNVPTANAPDAVVSGGAFFALADGNSWHTNQTSPSPLKIAEKFAYAVNYLTVQALPTAPLGLCAYTSNLGAGQLTIENWEVAANQGFFVSTMKITPTLSLFINGLRAPNTYNISTASVDYQFAQDAFPNRIAVSFRNNQEYFKAPRSKVTQNGIGFVDLPENEGVTGLTSLFGTSAFVNSAQDDKLVIFQENHIYLAQVTLQAVGTTSTGATEGGALPYLQLAQIDSRGVGCSFPRTIKQSKTGIYFCHTTGVYMLDRNNNLVVPLALFVPNRIKNMVAVSDQYSVTSVIDFNRQEFAVTYRDVAPDREGQTPIDLAAISSHVGAALLNPYVQTIMRDGPLTQDDAGFYTAQWAELVEANPDLVAQVTNLRKPSNHKALTFNFVTQQGIPGQFLQNQAGAISEATSFPPFINFDETHIMGRDGGLLQNSTDYLDLGLPITNNFVTRGLDFGLGGVRKFIRYVNVGIRRLLPGTVGQVAVNVISDSVPGAGETFTIKTDSPGLQATPSEKKSRSIQVQVSTDNMPHVINNVNPYAAVTGPKGSGQKPD